MHPSTVLKNKNQADQLHTPIDRLINVGDKLVNDLGLTLEQQGILKKVELENHCLATYLLMISDRLSIRSITFSMNILPSID